MMRIIFGLVMYIAIILCANFILPHGILRAFRGFVCPYISPDQIMSSVAIIILFLRFLYEAKP